MSSPEPDPKLVTRSGESTPAATILADLTVRRSGFSLEARFEVPASGFVGVIGPSGSGKTTLLRAISGLERQTQGEFRVGGVVWQNESSFVPPHRRSLGYVFQEPSLFEHLDVRRNLEFGYRRRSESRRRVSFDQAVALLGVARLLSRSVAGLSGGERQRVAIARAILTSPELLLMDEPLASLDATSKREVLPCLERLHRELSIPVLYVSHAAEEVARLSDYLIMMDQGRILAVGPVNDILTRADLPVARGEDAATVLVATVSEHDEEYQLTYLDFAGGRFIVTRRELEVGSPVRVRLLARDVSITLEAQRETSILNILAATVDSVTELGFAQALVRLDVGGIPMLSRVTMKSAAALGLRPGTSVYAQIKSVAIL